MKEEEEKECGDGRLEKEGVRLIPPGS